LKRFATYAQAGVSIHSARDFIRAIQPLAQLTRRAGLVRGIGGFGGLFEMSGSAGKNPILVASADGVGTKLCLAKEARLYEPLGIDLVAMNVNDLLCTGAEPLFFLDYIATGKLDPNVLMRIVKGIVRGCMESNCVLLGGETAQMPLVYKPADFDLAGFAVGIVDRRRLVTGEKIRAGQKVIGLASNGIHANGFTLVQRVLPKKELRTRAKELLKPTRIYVRPVLELLRRGLPVAGIAHITGGSFPEKLKRILPPRVDAVLRKGSWPVLPVFRRIQAAGVPEPEMYRTFNMGIGMAMVLPPAAVAKAQKLLHHHGVDNWVIGEVTSGQGEVRIR